MSEEHHETAQRRLASEVAASGPIIVVTEGSTDALFLRRSLELAHPIIAPFFRFLDFENYSAPGGTDKVVSLSRGLAAGGVMNRVLVVVDNDTAGRQAEQIIIASQLPSRMQVVRLPDISYARRYPTIGPTGPVLADVNGRAVSIELMFGESVSTEAHGGDKPRIRWTGYNATLDDYQGEIETKRNIQQLLRRYLSCTDRR